MNDQILWNLIKSWYKIAGEKARSEPRAAQAYSICAHALESQLLLNTKCSICNNPNCQNPNGKH